jgi:hypothetical protein
VPGKFTFFANKTAYNICKRLVGYFSFLGGLLIMAPFVLLMYQGYLWLKTGHWIPYSTGKIFIPILPDSFLSWLSTDSWVGLKKIIMEVMDIPIGIFSFVFGIGVVLSSFALGCKVDESFKTEVDKKGNN